MGIRRDKPATSAFAGYVAHALKGSTTDGDRLPFDLDCRRVALRRQFGFADVR
jgi:hypothetical protein